jgi:hypothetical protein
VVEYPAGAITLPEGVQMSLLVVYVALIVAGTMVSYGLGYVIEASAPSFSLLAFLLMYFFSLGICWYIAVRITAPKAKVA